jgi:hypothetical protein
MASPWNRIDEIEATFDRMPPHRRLAMASELLRWTVANFATPISDGTVNDLVTRASTAVREAVNSGRSAAPADGALLDEIDEAIQTTREKGARDLLVSYFLCFDQLAPEINPKRLVLIFDHCYQADYRRYSEVAIAVGEVDELTQRERDILDHQRALVRRYTE